MALAGVFSQNCAISALSDSPRGYCKRSVNAGNQILNLPLGSCQEKPYRNASSMSATSGRIFFDVGSNFRRIFTILIMIRSTVIIRRLYVHFTPNRVRVIPRNYTEIRYYCNIPCGEGKPVIVDELLNPKIIDATSKASVQTGRRRQFSRILNVLINDEEINPKTLSSRMFIHAPQWTHKCGVERKFASVVDKWWTHARPIFASSSRNVLKWPSYLIHLGKLHRMDRGRYQVLRKLGGLEGAITLFLRRMIDDGFEKYHYEDINSALTGLCDFLMPFSNDEKLLPPPILDDWLFALEEHLLKKKNSNDHDLLWILCPGATSTLMVLKDISTATDTRDTRRESLYRILCQFILDGFEYSIRNREEGGRLGQLQITMIDLANYAHLWHHWKRNPDSYAPNSVEYFFKVASMVMRRNIDRLQRNPTDDDREIFTLYELSSVPLMASVPQIPNDLSASEFWRLFDTLVKSVDCILIDMPSDVRSAHTSLFVSGLGKFVASKKNWTPTNDTDQLTAYPKKLDSLLGLLRKLAGVFRTLDRRNSSVKDIKRVLAGLSDCRTVYSASDISTITDQLLDYIERWATEFRTSTATNDASTRPMEDAGSTMFFLGHVCSTTMPSTDCLRDLSIVFECNFRSVENNLRLVPKLARDICYYANACSRFDFDPAADHGSDVWTVWFRVVGRLLERTKFDPDHLAHLLTTVLDITKKFQLFEEFRTLQQSWERAVLDHAHEFNAKRQFYIRKYVIDSDISQNLFDDTFVKILMRKVKPQVKF